MTEALARAIEAATGRRPTRIEPLSGGCVASVWKAVMADGETFAVKAGAPGSGLEVEGWMLDYLAARSSLPVPRVIAVSDRLLAMSWIEGGDAIDANAEVHAADHLASLHGVTAPAFGLERDTPIGGLTQPNGGMTSWRTFFRDRRLIPMARAALDAGQLPAALMGRIETLAERLDLWIDDTVRPSLIHGDMWGGNVLVRQGRIAGFVDPAIYYADAEIELAFATLFGTFGDAFFARYRDHRPLRPGFFEGRRDLYNLYPLLVHVRLFGGTYLRPMAAILGRLGC